MNTSEKAFEAIVEASLLGHGYRKRASRDYDPAVCLDPELLFEFIYATQGQAWERLKRVHGAQVKEKFLKRLTAEIVSRGTLDVLRRGVKDSGSHIRLAFFAPASGLNEEHWRRYRSNIFSVVRQLRYSRQHDNTLDLTLFLNGLPIVTAELKNHLTGQRLDDAIAQYRNDRDPRDLLFAHGRCPVHFAVDEDAVAMTTRLTGKETLFLPFNKGRNGGTGNPDNPLGYKSAYLWEEIWRPDSLLEILAHFLHVETGEPTAQNGKSGGALIFPRYHQLDAVRRLITHAREHGAGHSYLVQHSAGSGKSNTIAWLCHQLAGLHDATDERVFDSIIVVTDRRVLDRQLQGTIKQFEQTKGVVTRIERHSQELRVALESGKDIIVTTLQKFPYVVNDVHALPGRRFAVVIDEAHSSQSGTSTDTMKQVLAAASLDEAALTDAVADDPEDAINRVLSARGRLPHVSYFAFTATPKPKTLELFGTPQPDGGFTPFSEYSMRQAIEEGFILDVLQRYTTYRVYFSLLKKIADDPAYDRDKATYLLRSYAGLHPHAIDKKAEIMIDHFLTQVRKEIGGRAKAMVVTRSRLHAVRFKQAFDRYLAAMGSPFKTLVAFSGTVVDRETGLDYTESGMNSEPGLSISEAATAEAFKRDDYRIMIVAEKFQTGFDQPLLQTMYVDKRLSGVNAVQTLSRLNRPYPGKTGTMVLDFENDADEIERSFAPYYETTILREATDPNLLYDLERALLAFNDFSGEDVDAFARVYFARALRQDRLHPILDPVVGRYEYLLETERVDFKHQLGNFVRLYAFLAQIIPFRDDGLEKLYAFGRFLGTKLPVDADTLPVEISEHINMDSYRIQKMSEGRIALPGGGGILGPIAALGTGQPTRETLELLSQIIRDVNERYGTEFTEADKVILDGLKTRLAANQTLVNSALADNNKENLRLLYDNLFVDAMQELIDANFDLYKRVTDDAEFGAYLKGRIFDLVYEELGSPQAGSSSVPDRVRKIPKPPPAYR